MATFAFGRKDDVMSTFCTNCGNEVEQHARFCSKCGNEVAGGAVSAVAPARPQRTEHDMGMHISILGWLLVGSGILTAIGGLIVLFAGQFIRHLPMGIAQGMPPGIPPFAAWITSMVGISILTVAAATAAAGVGLLEYRSWARVFAIVIAVLLLFHFPLGTGVAIYAFWVLFSQEGQQYYKTRSESTMTAGGT
jgi:zinc-ribbon domain